MTRVVVQIDINKNIKLYKHLYYGEKAKMRKYKILWKIKHKKTMTKIYVITFPSNPLNVLDIYNYMELLQPYYQHKNFHVLGIAHGYKEALELVEIIIGEVYRETKKFNVKEYLTDKAKVKEQKES